MLLRGAWCCVPTCLLDHPILLTNYHLCSELSWSAPPLTCPTSHASSLPFLLPPLSSPRAVRLATQALWQHTSSCLLHPHSFCQKHTRSSKHLSPTPSLPSSNIIGTTHRTSLFNNLQPIKAPPPITPNHINTHASHVNTYASHKLGPTCRRTIWIEAGEASGYN